MDVIVSKAESAFSIKYEGVRGVNGGHITTQSKKCVCV